jgi:hypothetical protein
MHAWLRVPDDQTREGLCVSILYVSRRIRFEKPHDKLCNEL